MLYQPTELAELHQNFGRSNRVEHDGQMYVALPTKKGEASFDLQFIYNALKGAFIASTWDLKYTYPIYTKSIYKHTHTQTDN